jgi:phosphatidylglycerophosphatase A
MPVELTPRLLRRPIHLLATGLGAGLVPRAPGTAGSAVGVVLGWLMFDLPWPWRAAIAAAVFVGGVFVCGASARDLGEHDHPGIVLDEVAGMLATLLALAAADLWLLVLAFVLFRFFDIVKPWPIRDVDHRLSGGLGIMLDDLMAAGYAAVCLVIVQSIVPTT